MPVHSEIVTIVAKQVCSRSCITNRKTVDAAVLVIGLVLVVLLVLGREKKQSA